MFVDARLKQGCTHFLLTYLIFEISSSFPQVIWLIISRNGEGQQTQTPYAIVTQDGLGNFSMIMNAILEAPSNSIAKYTT